VRPEALRWTGLAAGASSNDQRFAVGACIRRVPSPLQWSCGVVSFKRAPVQNRGTSLIGNCPPPLDYLRGRQFLMSKALLYMCTSLIRNGPDKVQAFWRRKENPPILGKFFKVL